MVKDERKKTEDMEEEKHTAETSRVKRQNLFKVIERIEKDINENFIPYDKNNQRLTGKIKDIKHFKREKQKRVSIRKHWKNL